MNKKTITALVLGAILTASTLASTAQANTEHQILKNKNGAVANINGQLGHVSGQTAEQRAFAALNKLKDNYGFTQAEVHFQAKTTHKDENGTAHTLMNLTINGLPVYGQEMIVHEQDGDVSGITGTYVEFHPNATTAQLTKQQAIESALAAQGAGELRAPATATLLYYPQGEQALLAYQVDFAYQDRAQGNWTFFVDAVDGSVLDTFDANRYDNAAVGTSGNLQFNTYYYSNKNLYYLEDRTQHMYQTNGSTIETFTFRGTTTTTYYMTDSDNVWDFNYQHDGACVQYYMGLVSEYWYDQLGRNSYDDQGSSLYAGIQYGSRYPTLLWDGNGLLISNGDGMTYSSLACGLDGVAHELAHGVTEHTANLVNTDESGALSESWSDAFGATMDANDWLMGEDIYTPSTSGDALRDMSNPPVYGQPDNYADYVVTTSDNGGIHTNMGIPNKAFYNAATAIGSRDTAYRIWYVALRDYMTATTNFSGARAATLQAAAALYGSSSATYTAVANAWDAVGVY